MKRYRVKVEAGFRVAFQGDGTPRTDVFAVTVTNLSDKKVRVTYCATFEARVFPPRWIDRLTRKVPNPQHTSLPVRLPTAPWSLAPDHYRGARQCHPHLFGR